MTNSNEINSVGTTITYALSREKGICTSPGMKKLRSVQYHYLKECKPSVYRVMYIGTSFKLMMIRVFSVDDILPNVSTFPRGGHIYIYIYIAFCIHPTYNPDQNIPFAHTIMCIIH